MQIQCTAKNTLKTFPGVHESGGDLILGQSFEVHKKIFKKTLKKMFEKEAHCLPHDKVNTVSINNPNISC